MDQDEQFHSFWGEPTQMIDPTTPFFIPDLPKLPFDEQVQSPIIHEFSDGFQLSPTLIPMNSAPISTAAFPSFNSNESELFDKAENYISFRKCSSSQSLGNNISQINGDYIYNDNCQLGPINSHTYLNYSQQRIKHQRKPKSKLSRDISQEISIGANIIPSNSTQDFFENLSKVLDKPLTKEQIALISNILPRGDSQSMNMPSCNNFINSIPQKKSSFNINSFNQRAQHINCNNNIQMNDDSDFNLNCEECEFVINPQKLGFIPPNSWMDKEITFGYLVSSFFQKRNNASSRFSHKLYNALRLSSAYPNLAPYIGVEWITPTILKVNKYTFARLLKIKTIDGSLFHQQGNFPSHGFVELTEKESHECLTSEQLEDVDYESVRLLKHPAGIFTKDCTGSDIADCKWINSRRRPQ